MTSYPPALTHEADVPPMYGGDGADQAVTVARIRQPGAINSVEFLPSRDMTGANTNSRTLTLYNRGQSGAGTAVVATLALVSGVDLANGVAETITLGAGAGLAVVVGDVLEWESLHVGTGLPDPGGKVIVKQSLGS